MNESALKLYRAIYETHERVYRELISLQNLTQSAPLEEIADTAFVLREANKYISDLKGELSRLESTCEKIVCLKWMKLNEGDPIRTEYMTATPRLKQAHSLPSKRKNLAEYQKTMQGLNIPEHLWAGEYEAVRLHWPGVVDMLTERAEAGLPGLPGLDEKPYTLYALNIRRKKDILEETDE